MRATIPILSCLALFLAADAAQACGRRCRCRRGDFPAVVARPVPYPSVSYYSAYSVPEPTPYVAAPAPTDPASVRISQPTPAVGVQPLYTYEAAPQENAAYYYTYDESGKLVIRQWMDWLFRGGRRAGMPAPPLPIIGRLNNNN